MDEKKKLLLNCDVCDTRKMKEEDYIGYEEILLNADVVIVNEQSKGMLNRLPITQNSDRMVELADTVEVNAKVVNGSYEIAVDTAVAEHTVLVVNGSLKIAADAAEALRQYEAIVVNGALEYPMNLESFLSKMTINGPTNAYPENGTLLQSEFVIDKFFPMRAKENANYYVRDRIMIVDDTIDLQKLVDKQVKFYTKTVIAPEQCLEVAIPLFDEKVEFVAVPDGMKLVSGDCELDEQLIRKEGKKLFVYGNLSVQAETNLAELGKNLEELVVKGTVTLHRNQEKDFYNLNATYDKMDVSKYSKVVKNTMKVKLDQSLMNQLADGILVHNVAKLELDENVEQVQILERISIENCAKVVCSREQESAVNLVAQNVKKIEVREEQKEDATGDAADEAESEKNLLGMKVVNVDSYMM